MDLTLKDKNPTKTSGDHHCELDEAQPIRTSIEKTFAEI
jgi:hypothetical protein